MRLFGTFEDDAFWRPDLAEWLWPPFDLDISDPGPLEPAVLFREPFRVEVADDA